jgi:hypothetical protein
MRTRRWVADDRGQAIPLIAMLLAVSVALILGVAHLGRSVADAARARTAADAAALAGVSGGRDASVRLAGEHGGQLLSWSQSGAAAVVTVRVTVRVGRARATAVATNRPSDEIDEVTARTRLGTPESETAGSWAGRLPTLDSWLRVMPTAQPAVKR